MTRPTQLDVAIRAGVSEPTVSRCLRDDPKHPEPTRARVAAIAAELGYTGDARYRQTGQ